MLLFSIYVFSVLSMIAFSQEANIGKNIADFGINPLNGNIAFPTCSDTYDELVITDANLNEIERIQTLEFPESCEFSSDGTKLYLTIWIPAEEGFEHEYDENAKLGVLNTTTWSISYYNLPAYPVEMFVPNSNDELYLICGAYEHENRKKKLVKIDTSNGNILVNMECGIPRGGSLVMNHEESKIYLDSGEQIDEYELDEKGYTKYAGKTHSVVNVYNAQTYDLVLEIMVDPCISHMIQGALGKIILTHDCQLNEGDACVTVINTSNDSIEKQLNLYETCSWTSEYSINNNLYITPLVLSELHNEKYNYTYQGWKTTNQILVVNLTDDSTSWIQIAPEPIGPIALSLDCSRLYAVSADGDSPMVYYIDL